MQRTQPIVTALLVLALAAGCDQQASSPTTDSSAAGEAASVGPLAVIDDFIA